MQARSPLHPLHSRIQTRSVQQRIKMRLREIQVTPRQYNTYNAICHQHEQYQFRCRSGKNGAAITWPARSPLHPLHARRRQNSVKINALNQLACKRIEHIQ